MSDRISKDFSKKLIKKELNLTQASQNKYICKYICMPIVARIDNKMDMKKTKKPFTQLIILILFINLILNQQVCAIFNKKQKTDNVVAEMQVICHSDSIELKMNTNTPFNGMVYAKDAPSSNSCVAEYNSSVNMTFRLPLKSCGTLFAEADDGIEYFNTVVVQPHMRLMTNQGKGYHIRCKYQTRERTIANTHFNVSASFLMQNNPQAINTPLVATASMPSCTMKIFRSGRDDVAEAVKIGDKLIMVIEIDQQDMYGMRITNCVVRDGLNMAEQQLINDAGCPIDENIMPKFEYTNNSTRAAVSFPAHKFPHTSSVYYQCNVRLCINNGGCNQVECNGANSNNNGGPRKKRFVGHEHNNQQQQQQKTVGSTSYSSPSATSVGEPIIPSLPSPDALSSGQPSSKSSQPNAIAKKQSEVANDMSFDVYSGLYVSDIDVGESGSSDKNSQQILQPRDSSNGSSDGQHELEYCLTLGQASLIVLMASLGTIGIVIMLVCQIGYFGTGNEQQVSNGRIFSPDFGGTRKYYRSRNLNLGFRSSNVAGNNSHHHQQHQQQQHHLHHHQCSYDPETLVH